MVQVLCAGEGHELTEPAPASGVSWSGKMKLEKPQVIM